MWTLSLLTFSFFLLGTSAWPIINGDFVRSPKAFPFMVYLEVFEKTKVGHCGGVLVRRDAVLTAAHCLVSCTNKFDIRATVGLHDIDSDEGQMIRSSGFKVHEGFGVVDPADPKFAHNDIALVWLRRKFDLNENVMLATLPQQPVRMLNKFGTAIGWGKTQLDTTSPLLKRAQLKVIPMEKCQDYINGESFLGKSFCVKSDNELDGTCDGDSGGPFIFNGVVRGILSFSSVPNVKGEEKPKRVPKIPQVYTDIPAYYDWIHNQLDRRDNDAKSIPKNMQSMCKNSRLVYREEVRLEENKHHKSSRPHRGGHKHH